MRFLGVRRESDVPPRSARRWRWRVLAWGAGLVALVLAGAVVALHSLDQPWLKSRVLRLARTSGGVEIDYGGVELAVFSGTDIDGFTLRSPPEFQKLAPDVVRVGHVSARWDIRGRTLQKLTLSDITLTVVMDENGRTQFDALFPPDPNAKPSPPTPLSHLAASFLGSPLPLRQADLENVTLTLIRTDRGAVVDRITVRGVAATVATMSAAPARGWRVKAGLGSPAKPLDLALTRARTDAPEADARARLSLTLDATSENANAALDLRMLDQTFVPTVAADHWLHAEAGLHFDAAAGRTDVTIAHTEAGDGAASAEATVEVPDKGDPVVKRAQGDLDGARLLKWVPAGLLPVTADAAHLHYKVESLVAGAVPKLEEGGSVDVDAELSNVESAVGARSLHVDGGKLSLHAQPGQGGGFGGRGSFKLTKVRFASGDERVSASALSLDVDGNQEKAGAITAHAALRFETLAQDGGATASLPSGRVELAVKDVRVATDPLASQGDVTLSASVPSLDARAGGTHATTEGLTLRGHTHLEGHTPYALELDMAASRLRLLGPGDSPLVDTPAHVSASVHDVVPDLARPEGSRGVASVTVDVGDAKLTLDATKGRDAVDFTLHANAPSLKDVKPFLSPALTKRAPWDDMAVDLRSTGHAVPFGAGAPRIDQTTTLDVEHAAWGDVVARSVSLQLKSKGTATQHEGDIDLRAQGLAVGGGAPSDDHVTLSASLDREHRSLRFALGAEGRVTAKVSASASFDASHHAVPYTVDAHLSHLGSLSPFLAKVHGLEGFDVSQLEVALSSQGEIRGTVASLGRDGALQLGPRLSRTAGVEGKVSFEVSHFQWTQGDNAILAPSIVWHGDLHAADARRAVESHLEVDALHLDLGPKDVDLAGVRDDSSVVVTGDLESPESTVAQHTVIRTVKQDLVPEYPLGALAFSLAAEREANGIVHVSHLELINGAAATTIGVSGNVELGAGRHTLSVNTTVEQDLAHLTLAPEIFTGRGKLNIEASVVSPDMELLRVRAAVKAHDVFAKAPRAGIELDGANGEIPITVVLEIGEHGVSLKRDEARSPYSMLRFADQHPLLNRSGFLSITRLQTPMVTIAPLVGNLEIEQRSISLRQFEMGIRNGSITGQCGVNLDGAKSTLELHVRATGVQSSHGEPFDGNIAVVISAGDRTVEGRAEILRIGERHLLDLLDMQDPTHVDPGMNRIRTALLFGYPDRLRLVFDHGFASAKLELGGLARLVSISELRGIPMGPIVDKFLAPLLDPDKGQ